MPIYTKTSIKIRLVFNSIFMLKPGLNSYFMLKLITFNNIYVGIKATIQYQ